MKSSTYYILFLLMSLPSFLLSQTHPITFELINAINEDYVFIDNNTLSKGQEMRMVIENNSANTIKFNPLSAKSFGANSYHFKLAIDHNNYKYFSKTTLKAIKLQAVSQAIYEMKPDFSNSSTAYFYFRIKTASNYSLVPTVRKYIILDGFKASGKSGPMATAALHFSYQNVINVKDHFFPNIIHIKQPEGLENIPLRAGLLGSPTIHNNGSNNTVVIELENIASKLIPTAAAKIYYDQNTSIAISFLLEPNKQQPWKYPWSLTTKEKFKQTKKPIIKINGAVATHWHPTFSKDSTSWIISAQQAGSLSRGDSMIITLDHVVSKMPNGMSHIYVKYHNIIGYYDGHFDLPISKETLYTKAGKVGAGIEPTTLDSRNTSLQSNAGYYVSNGLPNNNSGYSFHGYSGSGDDGMYSTSATQIGLYADAKERLIIDKGDFSIKSYADNKPHLNIDAQGNTSIANALTVNENIKTKGRIYAKAGAPNNNNGYVFNGDNSTGMFSPADGEVAFYTKGKKQLSFDASGVATASQNVISKGAVYAKGGAPPNSVNKTNSVGFVFKGKGQSGLFGTGNGLAALYVDGQERLRTDPAGTVIYTPSLVHSGTAKDQDIITPPYGDRDDWALIVSGQSFVGSDSNTADDSLIHINQGFDKKGNDSWTAKCKVIWNNANALLYGSTYIYHRGCTVDYVLIKIK